jgi:hypothetical protein
VRCGTCQRDSERMNSSVSECSHIDCPHRRKAWSERPTVSELFRGPWPTKTEDADPIPLDKVAHHAPVADLKSTLAMTDCELQGAADALARRIAHGTSTICDSMVVVELANRLLHSPARGTAS